MRRNFGQQIGLKKKKPVKKIKNCSAKSCLPNNKISYHFDMFRSKVWKLSHITKIILKHKVGNLVNRVCYRNRESKNKSKKPCTYCINKIETKKATMSILSQKKTGVV